MADGVCKSERRARVDCGATRDAPPDVPRASTPDATAPTVTGTDPAERSIDSVARERSIRVAFSRDVSRLGCDDRSSSPTARVQQPGTYSYDSATFTATFDAGHARSQVATRSPCG